MIDFVVQHHAVFVFVNVFLDLVIVASIGGAALVAYLYVVDSTSAVPAGRPDRKESARMTARPDDLVA